VKKLMTMLMAVCVLILGLALTGCGEKKEAAPETPKLPTPGEVQSAVDDAKEDAMAAGADAEKEAEKTGAAAKKAVDDFDE